MVRPCLNCCIYILFGKYSLKPSLKTDFVKFFFNLFEPLNAKLNNLTLLSKKGILTSTEFDIEALSHLFGLRAQSISKENQKLRFQFRKDHDLKYWKLSSNDWKAHKNWQLLTDYKEQMFEKTSTVDAPWVVIITDNKMKERINTIRYVLT